MFGKVIALSGGFDPLHVGHVRMINHAAAYGQVVVILNSDKWLTRKKGYVFMSYEERAEILTSLRTVAAVRKVDDSDDSVCQALKKIMPDYFGNGGDRTKKNIPEKQLCEKLGIELLWNLGGPKINSSSELITKVTKTTEEEKGEKTMQEVPNDAIILSPDEARDIITFIDADRPLKDDDIENAYDALVNQLDEEVEED